VCDAERITKPPGLAKGEIKRVLRGIAPKEPGLGKRAVLPPLGEAALDNGALKIEQA
jgi:hypothetical protein